MTRPKPVPEPTKRCPGVTGSIAAHEAPIATAFARNKARPDGLSRVCRSCWSTYTRQRTEAATAAETPRIEPTAAPTPAPTRRARKEAAA